MHNQWMQNINIHEQVDKLKENIFYTEANKNNKVNKYKKVWKCLWNGTRNRYLDIIRYLCVIGNKLVVLTILSQECM